VKDLSMFTNNPTKIMLKQEIKEIKEYQVSYPELPFQISVEVRNRDEVTGICFFLSLKLEAALDAFSPGIQIL
jgi:hypothetical protein